jgi:hypothetical protein
MEGNNQKCFILYESVIDSLLEEEEQKLAAIKKRQEEIENITNNYFEGRIDKLKSCLVELDKESIRKGVEKLIINLDSNSTENNAYKVYELYINSDYVTKNLIRINCIELLNSENYVAFKDLLDYIDFME